MMDEPTDETLAYYVAELPSTAKAWGMFLDKYRHTQSAYARGWLAGRDAAAQCSEPFHNPRPGYEDSHDAGCVECRMHRRIQKAIRALLPPGAPNA